jgi:hypothetical protein
MFIIRLGDVRINSVAAFSPSTIFIVRLVMRVITMMMMVVVVVVDVMTLSVATISKLHQQWLS